MFLTVSSGGMRCFLACIAALMPVRRMRSLLLFLMVRVTFLLLLLLMACCCLMRCVPLLRRLSWLPARRVCLRLGSLPAAAASTPTPPPPSTTTATRGEEGGTPATRSDAEQVAHHPHHLAGLLPFGAGQARVDVWTCRGVKVGISQDDWIVQPMPSGQLRAAVVDGVTPWRSSDPLGQDSAVWAAGVVRTAARSELDPEAALHAAHRVLWDPAILPSRRRTSAAACIADVAIDPVGGLSVIASSAADCDCWVLADGEWQPLTGGDALAPTWRTAWEEEKKRRAFPDIESQLEAEAEFLDSPDCRPHPAVGRDELLVTTSGRRAGVRAVVLASDGARVTAAALNDVNAHLAEVCSGSHGDVTLISIEIPQ